MMRGSKKGPHAECVSSLRARSKDSITAIRNTELISSHVNSILMEGEVPTPRATVEDDGAVGQQHNHQHWISVDFSVLFRLTEPMNPNFTSRGAGGESVVQDAVCCARHRPRGRSGGAVEFSVHGSHHRPPRDRSKWSHNPITVPDRQRMHAREFYC